MPAHVFTTEEVADEKPCSYDITHFLQPQDNQVGAADKDKKTLRRLECSFFLNEDVLYKIKYDRSFSDAWTDKKQTC